MNCWDDVYNAHRAMQQPAPKWDGEIRTIDAPDWAFSQVIPCEEFEPAPWPELGVV